MVSSARAMHCGTLGVLRIYSSMHDHLTSYEVASKVTQVLSGLIIFCRYCLLLKIHWRRKNTQRICLIESFLLSPSLQELPRYLDLHFDNMFLDTACLKYFFGKFPNFILQPGLEGSCCMTAWIEGWKLDKVHDMLPVVEELMLQYGKLNEYISVGNVDFEVILLLTENWRGVLCICKMQWKWQ